MLFKNKTTVERAALQLACIAESIDVTEMVTPVNRQEARKCWLKNANNNFFTEPEFRYNRHKLKAITQQSRAFISESRNVLDNCEPETDIDKAILDILHRRLENIHASIQLAEAISKKDDATAASIIHDKYGTPPCESVIKAYQLGYDNEPDDRYIAPALYTLDERMMLRDCTVQAQDIQRYFQEALLLYGLNDWRVDISDEVASITVRAAGDDPEKRVIIPPDRTVDGLKLAELIGHEIETHVRTRENSMALFRSLIPPGTPLSPLVPLLARTSSMTMSEGMAKLSDVAISGETALPQPYYIIAIDQALRSESFGSVARTVAHAISIKNDLTHKQVLERAWQITYRVFRGISDTVNLYGYAFTSDSSYFLGYNYVHEKVAPSLYDYCNLAHCELQALQEAGVDLSNPAYPHQRAAERVTFELIKRYHDRKFGAAIAL